MSTKTQQLQKEQQKLFKNRKVIQLNQFIKGDVSAFTINDLKIFKLIISKVDSRDTLFKDFYEINTDEIKALNINEKHLYKETRTTLKRLANIYITFEDDDKIREVGLIRNDFTFEKYSKKILINFNDDMSEFLINLKKNFFMYDLIDIVNFKFKHTLNFYEHIKSQSLNVIKLKVDTVKKILNIEGKYKRYANFKKDVLEVMVNEINECANSLQISYTEEKIGPKVEYIIFHIKRFNSNILDLKPDNKYSKLINQECIYLDKYHILQEVNDTKFIIVLNEKLTNNTTTIVKDDIEGLEKQLKILFEEKYEELIDGIDETEDEIEKLKKFKSFNKFRQAVIEEFKGKDLANNMPGFQADTIIKIDEETGYLLNGKTGAIMTKEESLVIWKHLFKNKDLVGKFETKLFRKFIGTNVTIKTTSPFNTIEDIDYIINDIKEEKDENEEIKYRLYLQDILDPLQEPQKSKALLTYEQLEKFISLNEKNKSNNEKK